MTGGQCPLVVQTIPKIGFIDCIGNFFPSLAEVINGTWAVPKCPGPPESRRHSLTNHVLLLPLWTDDLMIRRVDVVELQKCPGDRWAVPTCRYKLFRKSGSSIASGTFSRVWPKLSTGPGQCPSAQVPPESRRHSLTNHVLLLPLWTDDLMIRRVDVVELQKCPGDRWVVPTCRYKLFRKSGSSIASGTFSRVWPKLSTGPGQCPSAQVTQNLDVIR